MNKSNVFNYLEIINYFFATFSLFSDNGLVRENQLFVEFGAGRGQLATWVMRAVGDDGVRKSAFVLVDRGSQRYKVSSR